MAKIIIEIDKCEQCPFVKKKNNETHDWFEDYAEVYDYICGVNEKEIACWVERPSEIPEVPDWCPILYKEE